MIRSMVIVTSLFINFNLLADVVIVNPLPNRIPRPIPLGVKYKNLEFQGIIRDSNITVLEYLTYSTNSEINFKRLGTQVKSTYDLLIKDVIKNNENFNPKLLSDLLYSIGNTNVVTDVDTLVQLILMEIAADASQDVKDMIKEMRNSLKSKKDLRDQVASTDQIIARCKQTPCDFNLLDLESKKDQLKKELDSMSEISEMDSLRLQEAMDRRSKLYSTLSNMLKKMSDTSSSIIQNMK